MPETRRESVGGVPWQQTSAETVEGELVCMAGVVSVQLTGRVIEPREHKARWFYNWREVKLAKCGFSKDCERCRVAASGNEVSRPPGKECRECIRVAEERFATSNIGRKS